MDQTIVNLYFEVDVPANAIRSCNGGGKGVVSCRVKRPAKYDHKAVYSVSFAFCSPKDNFSRPKAREITEARMLNGHSINVKLREKRPLNEVVGFAIKKLLREPSNGYAIPEWIEYNIIPDSDGQPRSIRMNQRRPRAHGR